jgi:glutamyl-tRNA synthetase
MARDELVDSFTLENISGGNAVFDTDKLDWMNAQYLARLPIVELAAHVRPRLEDAGLARSPLVQDETKYYRLLELLRPRAKRLADFVEQGRPLLASAVVYEDAAVEKNLSSVEAPAHLEALARALANVSPFEDPHVESVVRSTAAERGVKAGTLIHAVRVALTGRSASPGLFEMMALLGREETISRMRLLLTFLGSRNSNLP